MIELPVTVYTQPNCLPCKRVIKKLEQSNIEFDVVDITENERAYEFVKGLGAKSTPVVVGLGRAILGYEPTLLRDLVLDLKAEQIHDYVHEGDE